MYKVTPESPEGMPVVLQLNVNWKDSLPDGAGEVARSHLTLLKTEFPGVIADNVPVERIQFALGDPRFEAQGFGWVASLNNEVGILLRHQYTGGSTNIGEAEQRQRKVVFDFGEAVHFVECVNQNVINLCAFVPCVESSPKRFTSVYKAIGEPSRLRELNEALKLAATFVEGAPFDALASLANAPCLQGESGAIDFCL